MFESLSDRLQQSFRRLRGVATLSESNIADSLKEIRSALLEADVNLQIVRSFIDSVRSDCLGADVLKSVTPGQQLIKIVNDRLVELMGESSSPLDLDGLPAVIMMVGLHGSGKTTSSAKLAKHLKKEGKKVLLVAADIYRPAAIDQLEVLGREIGVEVYAERNSADVGAIAARAVEKAKLLHANVVIVDTAGRLQIDEKMVQELVRVKQSTRANEILLVADAALGQEAVSVAEHFHQALGLTGVVLTKLDGDARGGAALSIRKVTSCPVKFVGVGEKIDDMEQFYPDRMASRILGMGDVVSLVEKAADKLDAEENEKLHKRLKKNQFDFNDFLGQLRQISKLGGAEGILKMLPGGRDMAKAAEGALDEKSFVRLEAIILSMNNRERENPDLIDFSRRKRIARGSGTTLEMVAKLIKQFNSMRKMMKKTSLMGKLFGAFTGRESAPAGLGKMGDGAAMRGMDSLPYFGNAERAAADTKAKEHRRKLNKQKKKQKQKQRKKKR